MSFAAELRRAMAARGLTNAATSALCGVPETSLSGYRNGKRPHLTTAHRLAEALVWPRLIEIAIGAATKRCVVCDREFVDGGQQLRAFACSRACYRTIRSRRMRDATEVRQERVYTALRRYEQAVEAFCRECTLGDVACRDDECRLRPISPLPFIPLSKVSRRNAA